ncbi:MAG TPA: hypothetical protein VLT33_27575 [Labilithrix sp.]|nr:hypothetical protein [Labilithrix sp.]
MASAGMVFLAGFGSSCNLDPVHRAGVNNLGEENSSQYPPESEYHRPGEPCTLCHSKEGPADTEYVLGGTIFWGPDRYDRRVDQAYVRIGGPEKTTKCFVTNCNGNFFVKADDYKNLKFPLLVSVERVNRPGGSGPNDEKSIAVRRMSGHIGREGSCATCHILGLRDFGSPGQVRLFDTEGAVDTAKVPIPQSCPNEEPRVTACPEDRL